jgi:pimeloyl-ACP methyl ester carboxylesterase
MATPRPSAVRAPRPALALLEQRALFELGAFAAASPLLRTLGRGDRHPVLVLPGFTAGDRSTAALRTTIRSWGYWAHGWRLGQNWGPTPERVAAVEARLLELHARHGRKVSLVGWSLGGIYSRFLARAHPDKVRQVVSLGSPFRLNPLDRSTLSPLVDRLFTPDFVRAAAAAWVPEDERPPVPVPTTAMYSRTDGVVRWHLCIDAEGPQRENIEVRGSHSGLGWNPAVLYALADRLAQPEDDWRPFHPPAALRRLYPRPVWWTPSHTGGGTGRRRGSAA